MVQYNGVFLPDIILLTQCYYRRGTRLNAMKRFLSLQPMIPPNKRFDMFSLRLEDAEKVSRSDFSFKSFHRAENSVLYVPGSAVRNFRSLRRIRD